MLFVEIRIKGRIDPSWTDWLGGLEVAHIAEGGTLLSGALPDQAALYGLISRLRDLGLALISVEIKEEVGE